MLNRGIPVYVVSRILGHSKASTTLDIYGHLIPVMHEGIGDMIDGWLTPVPIDMGERLESVTKIVKSRFPNCATSTPLGTLNEKSLCKIRLFLE
jgi:hypothetical protein